MLRNARPLFHSEADFQFSLATTLMKVSPSLKIRLERPVRVPGCPTMHTDMMFFGRDTHFAVELKYLTARLEAKVQGEEYLLRNQSALDLQRYDIVKDISRLETLCASGVTDAGVSITITNDQGIWKPPSRVGTVDEMYRLRSGRIMTGKLRWLDHATEGTTRRRNETLTLSGKYLLDWKPYSIVESERNSEFRSLTVCVDQPLQETVV